MELRSLFYELFPLTGCPAGAQGKCRWRIRQTAAKSLHQKMMKALKYPVKQGSVRL